MDIGESKEAALASALSKQGLDKEALSVVMVTGWRLGVTPRFTSLAVTLH